MDIGGPGLVLCLLFLVGAPGTTWAIWALRARSFHQRVWKWRIHTVGTIAYYVTLVSLYTVVFTSPTETPATSLGCMWLFAGLLPTGWNLAAAFDLRPPDGIPRCRKCGYDLRGSTSGRCPECGTDHSPRR
ncbi:MAG: hypothetical protein IT430_08400 [Phycisphaerales bacterium]|nr:hypothetical protein [Phycisphaerales bacterium]